MIFTNEQFRIEMIRYLSEKWQENLTSEQVAETYGYSDQYFNIKFKECFGMPFLRYLVRLRLHRAAIMISENHSLMNVGKAAGYANAQSFSKAFRKEFGLSPKQFLYSEDAVPDLNLGRTINGDPVHVEYVMAERKNLHCKIFHPLNENKTDLLEEVGYYFDHDCSHSVLDKEQDKIEIWWHDEKCNMLYIMGVPKAELDEVPEGMMKLVIPSDYYAVFSVRNQKSTGWNGRDYSDTVKQLTRYAFQEWIPMNEKNVRQMGYTFVNYKKDGVLLYVPIHKRTSITEDKAPKFKGAMDWIQYIDTYLKENLTVKGLADAFNYSERHFTDTFEMYYGVRPGMYIRKRRLYLAAKELRQGETDMDKLVEEYGFPSMATFRRNFREEFLCNPEDYEGEEYKVENLSRYYTYHKKKLKIYYEEMADLTMAGKNVFSYRGRQEDAVDLIESITWMLQYEDFHERQRMENKIVVWETDPEKKEHKCLVGPELKCGDMPKENYRNMTIRGGFYIVMETLHKSDMKNLTDTYRMMYRCAYAGWLRENQERIDLSRLSFVRYKKGKLYFYIPINA